MEDLRGLSLVLHLLAQCVNDLLDSFDLLVQLFVSVDFVVVHSYLDCVEFRSDTIEYVRCGEIYATLHSGPLASFQSATA